MVTTAKEAATLAMLLSAGAPGWVAAERQPVRISGFAWRAWLQRALGVAC